mgnify:CR=1 FL=1
MITPFIPLTQIDTIALYDVIPAVPVQDLRTQTPKAEGQGGIQRPDLIVQLVIPVHIRQVWDPEFQAVRFGHMVEMVWIAAWGKTQTAAYGGTRIGKQGIGPVGGIVDEAVCTVNADSLPLQPPGESAIGGQGCGDVAAVRCGTELLVVAEGQVEASYLQLITRLLKDTAAGRYTVVEGVLIQERHAHLGAGRQAAEGSGQAEGGA